MWRRSLGATCSCLNVFLLPYLWIPRRKNKIIFLKIFWKMGLTHFIPLVSFNTAWKYQETFGSYVFMGYRKWTVASNGKLIALAYLYVYRTTVCELMDSVLLVKLISEITYHFFKKNVSNPATPKENWKFAKNLK